MINPSDTQTELRADSEVRYKIAELMFLKLGIDMARKETQYPLLPHKDRDEFLDNIVNLIHSYVTQARIDENDYHWHHQKHIEKLARNGGVSGYFLERKDELNKGAE